MSKPFVPTVIVGEAIAGESAKVRNKLETLINSVNKSTLDIGELLYSVKYKGHYAEWGFPTFNDYVKSLNIKERKAQYLTRIVGVLSQVGIARGIYEALGIARLREITSLEPDGNYVNPETGLVTPMAEYIKGFCEPDAETGELFELEKLKHLVKLLKGMAGPEALRWVNLQMTNSAYDNTWLPAMNLAKANIGSVGKDDEGISKDASDGAAAEVLAISYLNDPANQFADLLTDLLAEEDEADVVTEETDVEVEL